MYGSNIKEQFSLTISEPNCSGYRIQMKGMEMIEQYKTRNIWKTELMNLQITLRTRIVETYIVE
jgi:hypothetical protein